MRPVKPPRLDKRGNPVMEKTERHGNGLRWVATWTEHGKRRAKSFRTKDAALAHLADIARAQLTGTHVESTKVTVTEFAEQWMPTQLQQKATTRRTMMSRWTNHIQPAFGDLRIQQVTTDHIERAVQKWDNEQSPASVRSIFTYTKALFRAAERKRVINRNPCDGVELTPVDRDHIIPVTTEQVWDISYRVHPRFQALVLAAAATGFRSAELRGLVVNDILRDDVARVRCRRQLATTTTAPAWTKTKTPTSVRTITIDQHTLGVIDYHMRRVPPHSSGLIFTGEHGGPLHPEAIQSQLRDIAKDMGLPARFGLHQFRHYHASLLIAAGLSVTAVATRLGHKNSTETLRTYAHLWGDDEDRSRAAIEKGMFG